MGHLNPTPDQTVAHEGVLQAEQCVTVVAVETPLNTSLNVSALCNLRQALLLKQYLCLRQTLLLKQYPCLRQPLLLKQYLCLRQPLLLKQYIVFGNKSTKSYIDLLQFNHIFTVDLSSCNNFLQNKISDNMM